MIYSLFVNPPEFTMAIAGDIMLNGITPSERVFGGIQKELSRPDVCLANLEVPLTDTRVATSRKSPSELRARSQFILKANPNHAPFLAKSGIDLVSLANNHGMDYGAAGNAQMRGLLTRYHIGFAGAGQDAASAMKVGVITLRSGVRVGLFSALAFIGRGALLKTTPATEKPGINVLNFNGKIDKDAMDRIGRIVALSKAHCDFLVVGLHWGIERQTLPTAYQAQLGRAFVDAGANLVWGHHPHVLQGYELYHGVPIFYSMGNLISPTPAASGIIHLRFSGTRLTRSFFQGIAVSGGRAQALVGTAQKNQQGRFQALCQALAKRFPPKN